MLSCKLSHNINNNTITNKINLPIRNKIVKTVFVNGTHRDQATSYRCFFLYTGEHLGSLHRCIDQFFPHVYEGQTLVRRFLSALTLCCSSSAHRCDVRSIVDGTVRQFMPPNSHAICNVYFETC